jgi:hypothetical protein
MQAIKKRRGSNEVQDSGASDQQHGGAGTRSWERSKSPSTGGTVFLFLRSMGCLFLLFPLARAAELGTASCQGAPVQDHPGVFSCRKRRVRSCCRHEASTPTKATMVGDVFGRSCRVVPRNNIARHPRTFEPFFLGMSHPDACVTLCGASSLLYIVRIRTSLT